MEKVEQHIENQDLHNSSISRKYLYWVIIIYGLVSFLRVISVGFLYIDYLGNLGNFLFVFSTIFAFPSLLLVILLIIKRVPFSIILVPLLYVLLPSLVILLAFISLYFFGVPLYNSEFSNTFLFRVMANNYFLPIYYLSIVFYSILVIKKLTINRPT
jgi:hypothetical protein